MPDLISVFILDPPERLDPPTDTSLALMRAGIGRGHAVYFCTLDGLRLEERPHARVRPVIFPPNAGLFTAGAAEDLDLTTISVLFMRKDPPVDAAYLQAAAILDRLPSRVLQVNPARALRLHGEKLIPLYFPGLAPETMVTASAAELLDFLDRHGRIVVKPLEDCSGRGIFVLHRGDPLAADRLALATANGERFVQGQRFLPEIAQGDKRVLLLGGEILGWVRRLPAAGEFRTNINAGGRCVSCELTESDRAICERLRPWLQQEEIHLAGVDIVGEQVLEVNITSPSCLREINALSGVALEETVLDYVEAISSERSRQHSVEGGKPTC
jgi:glutathione synthase